jgi:PAS domain S-box-containing protein
VAAEQQPVELILARGLISNLATPGFLVDEAGRLVFYNDAAGELLGVRFEEVGSMEAEEWGTRFEPVGPDGDLIPVAKLPLARALTGEPTHSEMRITSATGQMIEIEVTALPILGTGGQKGALALFWSRGPG